MEKQKIQVEPTAYSRRTGAASPTEPLPKYRSVSDAMFSLFMEAVMSENNYLAGSNGVYDQRATSVRIWVRKLQRLFGQVQLFQKNQKNSSQTVDLDF